LQTNTNGEEGGHNAGGMTEIQLNGGGGGGGGGGLLVNAAILLTFADTSGLVVVRTVARAVPVDL
jgi:hypothetical protein